VRLKTSTYEHSQQDSIPLSGAGLPVGSGWSFPGDGAAGFRQFHVIEVVADKDSHFKMPDRASKITVKAGEPSSCALLRAGERRGTATDRPWVHAAPGEGPRQNPGWDLELKDGTQEFT